MTRIKKLASRWTVPALALVGWVAGCGLVAGDHARTGGRGGAPLQNTGSGVGDFVTLHPPMLRPLLPSVKIRPILTTGDQLGDFQFAGTPDGMGWFENEDTSFSLLVNHEWSATGHLGDALVSRLRIDAKTLHVLGGDYVVTGSEGFQRFCAGTAVRRKEGFDPPLFLTNEESTAGRHGGIVVAIDPRSGATTLLPHLGFFKHENSTAIPYRGKIVVLSGEDDWPGGLYSYVADTRADFLAGRGTLHVLQVKDRAGRVLSSEAMAEKGAALVGRFVPLTTDDNRNATTLAAAAKRSSAFPFVRVEDSELDQSEPRTVWFATTGRSSARDPQSGVASNVRGNLWKLKMDANDPSRVALTLVLSGDRGDDILNPDNLATSRNSVMIQEDLQEEFLGTRPGRILRYDLKSKRLTPIAEIVQLDGNGQPIPKDKPGSWESSGMISTSALLGEGSWLLNVQAHSYQVPQLGGTDEGGQILFLKLPGS